MCHHIYHIDLVYGAHLDFRNTHPIDDRRANHFSNFPPLFYHRFVSYGYVYKRGFSFFKKGICRWQPWRGVKSHSYPVPCAPAFISMQMGFNADDAEYISIQQQRKEEEKISYFCLCAVVHLVDKWVTPLLRSNQGPVYIGPNDLTILRPFLLT